MRLSAPALDGTAAGRSSLPRLCNDTSLENLHRGTRNVSSRYAKILALVVSLDAEGVDAVVESGLLYRLGRVRQVYADMDAAIVSKYATLPLPYYHHASTVPTLVMARADPEKWTAFDSPGTVGTTGYPPLDHAKNLPLVDYYQARQPAGDARDATPVALCSFVFKSAAGGGEQFTPAPAPAAAPAATPAPAPAPALEEDSASTAPVSRAPSPSPQYADDDDDDDVLAFDPGLGRGDKAKAKEDVDEFGVPVAAPAAARERGGRMAVWYYATLPLPYYHHASTVPTLVRLSFPFPLLYNQLLSYDCATVR
ncbi:hypothetical protein AURANDRAFT_68194 [Aureococcus anophagefferens]|uniref:Uncharacterized protein n=1 Tax=Aureococcus anophagefferens TaxID=44056 RepID=F0YNT4_AURAN|nr:hypothetical protein AURANDRAFT_68194 [Aureococcus anophagefferens]EGB03223.1 hypothetical protein AURANDRAFT_68194 [Aureococcus anophagefferens]|eukprot:XP_009042076.1 hypothetical protein AURANDRAFT_68194 [Aureococcus anophagefferens]